MRVRHVSLQYSIAILYVSLCLEGCRGRVRKVEVRAHHRQVSLQLEPDKRRQMLARSRADCSLDLLAPLLLDLSS